MARHSVSECFTGAYHLLLHQNRYMYMLLKFQSNTYIYINLKPWAIFLRYYFCEFIISDFAVPLAMPIHIMCVYRIARNFGGQKFGELVISRYWRLKFWRIECQEVNTHVHSTRYTRVKRLLLNATGEIASFCVDAMVRGGYHEYQDIWTDTSGERLKCARKIGNRSDLFAVAVHFGLHSLVHCTNHRWLKILVD